MSAQGFTDTGIVLGGDTASPAAGPYDQLIRQSAEREGIDPDQFRRQMYTENPKMDPLAVSPRGAVGIPQLMPSVSQAYGIDATKPEQSIPVAAIEMRKHTARYGGDQVQALTAYNWGSGNLQKFGLANAPAESRKYYTAITGKPFPGATAQQVPVPANTDDGSVWDQPDAQSVWDQPDQAPPAGPAFTDTGIVLGQQPPEQSFTDTGIILSPPSPLHPVTQLPDLPSQWGQGQDQPEAPPISATNMPPLGQPPVDLSKVVPNDLADPNRAADPAVPWHPEVPWYSVKDVPSSLQEGAVAALREGRQTARGQAFTDQAPQAQPQRSFAGGLAFGMGHSSPTFAATAGGAALGEAVAPEAGPIGPIVGGGLAGGAMSFVQALKPAYDEGRDKKMSHDEAVNYAFKKASTEGGINLAAAPAFAFMPPSIKSWIGKTLFQAYVTQPAVGTAGRLISPLITGDKMPTGKELLEGAAGDVLTGHAIGLGHGLYTGAKRATTEAEILRNFFQRNKAQPGQQEQPSWKQTRDTDHQFSETPKGQDAESRFHVDDRGFVVSDKGGPVRFDKHVPAARQILKMQQQSPDQIFQLENHPSGSGLGIRETGRSEPQQAQEPPAQGEPADEPIQTAANAAAAPEPSATSQDVEAPVGTGGQPQPAGGTGNETGGIDTAPVSGADVSAQAANTDGNVSAAGQPAEQPKAAFTGLQTEPLVTPAPPVTGQAPGTTPGNRVEADKKAKLDFYAATMEARHRNHITNEQMEGLENDVRTGKLTPEEGHAELQKTVGTRGATHDEVQAQLAEALREGTVPSSQIMPFYEQLKRGVDPAIVRANYEAHLEGQRTGPKRGTIEWDMSPQGQAEAHDWLRQREAAKGKKPGEVLTSTGESVPVHYEVADASQLAHPEAGDPRQPRNRETSAASAAQIGKIAGNLDPRQLMESDVADRGAPIVNATGTVLAGNGRFAAIKAAAENHPEKYQAYVDAIKAAGHKIPEGVKTPVLVRRTGQMSPEAETKLARDSNVSRAMSMGAVEQAHVDAAHITDKMMSSYVPGDPRSERAWLGTLPDTEHAAVINEDGTGLSKAGQQRLKGAMLAKAYGHPDLLKRALEDPNDDTKGITNSLAEVAPQWAKMKARIAAGEVPEEFDITKNLAQALDMVRQQRESNGKITPSDMVDQLDLERGPLHPITEQLYRSFYNDGMTRLNSAKGLTGILDGYLRAAHNYTPQESFAGWEPSKPNPAEIIKGLRSEKQESLFDAEDDQDEEDQGEEDQGQAVPLSQHEQAFLEAANTQIANLQKSGANPTQLKALLAARDELLARGAPKVGPRRRKTKTSTMPPRSDAAPKNFEDYKFLDGTPVFRDAFIEYAERGGEEWQEYSGRSDPATRPEALEFARDAVNFGIDRQVKVLADQVKHKFNFTEVAISNRLSAKDARDNLLDLNRAVHDMMFALGNPVEMASMNGKVRLELNPPNKKAYGSYDPETKTIAVNGRVNVFGHEWIHAWDHDITSTLFNIQNPGILASHLSRNGSLDPNNPMTVRMGHLMNTLFHDHAALALEMMDLHNKSQEVNNLGQPTRAADRALAKLTALQGGARIKGMQIDPSAFHDTSEEYGAGKAYWLKPWEMMARAGEHYLARTMNLAGVDPRGVVMPLEAYATQDSLDDRLMKTFPKGTEAGEIFLAYDHLVDGYRMAALTGSIKATQALRDGMSDPAVWGKWTKNKNKMGLLRELVYRLRHFNDSLARTAMTDPSRPDPGARHFWKRMHIGFELNVNSVMGTLEAMKEWVPDAAKPYLQEVMDRLGQTVGSGRHTGWEPYEERQHLLSKRWIAQYTNILRSNGFDPEALTQENKDHLRHAMTTGETRYPIDPSDPNSGTVPINPRINDVASQLRPISDQIHTMLEKAGYKIGYAKNGHFTRIYDVVRADAEPDEFIKDASGLHKEMFDDEIGTPGDNPEKLHKIWQDLPAADRQSNSLDAATRDGMIALHKTFLRRAAIEREIAAGGRTPELDAEYKQLEADAEQLAIDHHDGAGNHIALLNAERWLGELRDRHADEWEKTGPGGNFLNKRTLPPSADQRMRRFMVTDPGVVLLHYYDSAARKIAYAERFGAEDEQRKDLIKKMREAGMHGTDIAHVQHAINIVVGRQGSTNTRGIITAANFLRAAGALYLLDRAVFSMIAEPFNAALANGSMRAGFHALAAGIGDIMRTEDAQGRAEFADLVGITNSAMTDDLLANRWGADYSDSPNMGKAMSWFYRMTWQTQAGNWGRRAAVASSDYMLDVRSRHLLSTKKGARADDRRDNARRAFNELGIPENEHADFAVWKLSHNGRPVMDAPENARFANTYARAMRRLNKRTIIDPNKAERPILQTDSWFGLAMQFQSFNFGYQRNILDPMVRSWGHAYKQGAGRGTNRLTKFLRGGGNSARAMSHSAAIIGAVIAIGMLQAALRQWLFDKETWDLHKKAGDLGDWLRDLAVSRSGLSGTPDPGMQAVTHLRYNQDLTSLLLPPAAKLIAKNGYDALSLVANPSGDVSNSNTRAHAAVKASYQLLGIPLSGLIATRFAAFGRLATVLGGATNMWTTSPDAAEKFATAVVGPPGTTLPEHKPGELPKLPKPRHLPRLPKLGQPPQGASREGISGAQNLGSAPTGLLGLADDIILPIAKVAGPVIGMLPNKLKLAAAMGLIGYEAKKFWDRYEPYRNAPPPKPKEPAN